MSLSHGLKDYPLRSLPVPFAVEDALPGSEIEPGFGDRDDDLVADSKRTQVSGGVVLAGTAVMPVAVGLPRRDVVLEPIEDVLPKAGLMIVHEHRRGDVHRRHEDHALVNVGSRATSIDTVRDVDDLLAAFRVEGEIVGMGLHWRWRGRPSKGGWRSVPPVCFTTKLSVGPAR